MNYYVWNDDDCSNVTEDINEARTWRDEFLAEGQDSYIVDEDNEIVY